MKLSDRTDYLLECLIHILGRIAMPVEKVSEVVGQGTKQRKAFNLCDGSNTQMEVAKKTGIAQGNLSATFKRWVQNGVAYWIGEGKDARLLHIYPLPEEKGKGAKRKRKP